MWLLNSELREGSPPWDFSSPNSLPTMGCQKPDQIVEVLNTWYMWSLSLPRATEWCQTVKGNAGILYLEASQNTATVTLSHARGFASTHQRRPHRSRAQQGSPVHLYIYLGMAGHSHGPELRTKSTDEWDRTSHQPLHLWRNHSAAIDQAASLESRLLCWGEFNLTISSRKTKTLLF